MEEESEKKGFEIVKSAKKKVVKFGSVQRNATVERKQEEAKEAPKKKVNDNFAKHSLREPLKEGEYPRELKHQFSMNRDFEAAFEKLDQGVKDGYLFYFRGPKLTTSITNRIVKKIDRIMNDQGLNDCICGLSKSLPNCDGSHKTAKIQ